MRDRTPELRAARSLRRWLRRAALAALPIAGLAGCGSDCGSRIADYDDVRALAAAVPWAVGSEHSAEACTSYCYPFDDTCYSAEIAGCRVAAPKTMNCHMHVTRCVSGSCGRLPSRLLPADECGQPSLVAGVLAGVARLEEASVFAFSMVERELIAHGAPARLIARARSAQRDEERHHRAMSGLARRFGAQIGEVAVDDTGVRPLAEMAVENAVEGCVRETFGAAVAAVQGECAGDRAVRRAMRSIAADEAEHAALGWAIDAWASARLQAAERARVQWARRTAVAQLIAQAEQPVAPELCAVLGLPDAAASSRMLAAFAPLWSCS